MQWKMNSLDTDVTITNNQIYASTKKVSEMNNGLDHIIPDKSYFFLK